MANAPLKPRMLCREFVVGLYKVSREGAELHSFVWFELFKEYFLAYRQLHTQARTFSPPNISQNFRP
jgi:hypothetical protein